MKVDIILPIYNGEKYLSECIESVLNQTYSNINLIILDDYSTDLSSYIVNSFNDTRIQFHKNAKNLGLFKTLNKLIELSSSDFFHIWSQDDIMEPNCIEVCVEYFEKYNFKMAYSAIKYINTFGEEIEYSKVDNTPTVIPKELFIAISVFYGSIAGNIANVCLSRDCIKQLGGFDESYIVSGDFEYWVRVGLMSEIIYINQPLIKLRTHIGQFSRQHKSAYLFMIEDDSIFSLIKSNIKEYKNILIASKYISWKNYTHYFNVAIFLLYKSEYKLFFKSIAFINKKEFIISVFIKWLVVRVLRMFKKEDYIYKKLINKYNV